MNPRYTALPSQYVVLRDSRTTDPIDSLLHFLLYTLPAIYTCT